MDEYAYNLTMDGVDKEIIDGKDQNWAGLVYLGDVEVAEAKNSKLDITEYIAVIVTEDSQGFVECSWYNSLNSADAEWNRMEGMESE